MIDFFLQLTPIPENKLEVTYNVNLIIISFFISIFLSYISINFLSQSRFIKTSKRPLNLWLIASAFIMCIAIWAVHFIGCLAFDLQAINIPTTYSLYPFFTVFITISFAFYLLQSHIISPTRIIVSGTFLGLSIALFHYLAMEAMAPYVTFFYLPSLFFLSLIWGILVSNFALWMQFKISSPKHYQNYFSQKWVSSALMGLAICGTHYIGNSATIFVTKDILERTFFTTFQQQTFASFIASVSLIAMMFAFFLSRNKETLEITNEMEESKSLLMNIIESSIEHSIIASDLQGKILVWNRGATYNYGYKAEEMVNKENINILSPIKDVQSGATRQFLDKALKEGKSEGILKRIKKNGSSFTASVVINVRRNERGQAIGFVIVSKNITKQIEFESQLIQTNQELEQFAYVASHDLKAPLRSMSSLISWIEKDKENILSEESKQNFKLLNSRANRMSNLIEGILQYSRVGRIKSEVSKISVNHLVHEIIEVQNIPKKFTIHISDNLPTFYGNKLLLSQVFANLISNAVKFHDKPEGKIEIGCNDKGRYFEFFVSDDGPGIEPQYHLRIFEIFQTLQPRDIIESTGIGLSIVKKIVESQGGKIVVESELNKGTTFYFTWPKVPPSDGVDNE